MDFESKTGIIDLNKQLGVESVEIVLEILLTGVLTFLMATTGQVIRGIVNPLGNTFDILAPLSGYAGEFNYMVWGYGSVQEVTNTFGQIFGIYDPDDSERKRIIGDPFGQFAVESVKLASEVALLGVLMFLIATTGQAIMRIVNPIGNAFPGTPLEAFAGYNGQTEYIEWGYREVQRVTNSVGKILGVYESIEGKSDPINKIEQMTALSKQVSNQIILTGVLEFLLHSTGQLIKMIVNPIGEMFPPENQLNILSVYDGQIANFYWGYRDVQRVTNSFGEILGIYNPQASSS